jgi:hypothetical protein
VEPITHFAAPFTALTVAGVEFRKASPFRFQRFARFRRPIYACMLTLSAVLLSPLFKTLNVQRRRVRRA